MTEKTVSTLKRLQGATSAVNITDALGTHKPCISVYIGVTGDYDFTADGTTWVEFKACQGGTILPIQARGARHASGDTAPNTGDITFLY